MSASILVIDDSQSILTLAQRFLEAAGYQVMTSTNPILAANEIRAAQPDLVLVDVEMPGLQGTEVVATLKRFDFCPNTPLVLFSSLSEELLAQRAAEVGADGWIRKGSPLSGPTLVRRVREFLVQRPKLQLGTALVVDDSIAMRTLLGTILKDVGLEVAQARDGREALGQMDGKLRVALVDLNMPVMDGLEFVESVRRQPSFDGVQILMVTSETDSRQIERLLQAGANEYLMKPFNKDAILAKLRLLGVSAA